MNHLEPQGSAAPAPQARIDTLDSLREHLQWAIELEHATLPPYLCALYSLDPERNPEAVGVVGSVFVEEMLHLALAANLLNAVGGRPRLDTPRCRPRTGLNVARPACPGAHGSRRRAAPPPVPGSDASNRRAAPRSPATQGRPGGAGGVTTGRAIRS